MSDLRAGAGRQRITPPVGIPLFSHLNPERMSEGVRDDLWAKVLVLEKDDERVAKTLNWKTTKVRDTRQKLQRAGYFRMKKYKSGDGDMIYKAYLGKESWLKKNEDNEW